MLPVRQESEGAYVMLDGILFQLILILLHYCVWFSLIVLICKMDGYVNETLLRVWSSTPATTPRDEFGCWREWRKLSKTIRL